VLADSHELLSTLEQKVSPTYAALLVIDREAGVLVIFIQAIYDPQYLLAPMCERDLHVGARMPRCLMGSWGADFHVVARRANEPVVIKHRYSAFANSELDDLLKRHGIRNLLLAGVATDTCAESTGRDAYFIGYYVTLVADCCAGAAERDHRVALERFEHDYGAVVNSPDVIEAWQRSDTPTTRSLATRTG